MKDTGELCGPRTNRGYNQTTASGFPFWVLDPRPEDIRIEDIAAQVSHVCRFGGAVKRGVEHYSVAQHSVLVSEHVAPEFALEALLHDAGEAYVGDIIKPTKMLLEPDFRQIEQDLAEEGLSFFGQGIALCALRRSLGVPSYKRLEKRVDTAIRAKFGLPATLSPEVKEQDYRAVLTEHRDLQIDIGLVDWGFADLPPWPEVIVPVSSSVAEAQFLQRFNELYKGEKSER
jgi:uncharacterized protein